MTKIHPRAAAALALAITSAGCVVDPPVISPRFGELEPRTIAVLPVENRTLKDLSNISTAQWLQRLTIGSRGIDVPAAFRMNIIAILQEDGYRAGALDEAPGEDPRAPLPAGASRNHDAVLRCGIDRWHITTGAYGGELEISGDLEIIRVADAGSGGGEVLFQKAFFHRAGAATEGVHSPGDLFDEVARAARSALRGLPERKKETPAPVAASKN